MVKKMIKRKVVYLSLILFLSLTLIFPGNWVQAASGIPDNLGYQGRLKDNSGLALDGNFDFIFKLYDTASGGTPLWTETKSDVKVEAGYFSVNLGESVPFSGSVDFTRPLWLEVYVAPHGQTPEKTEPRIAINSVAFALSARAIENLPSEPTTNLYGGRMYYNTTTGKIYVYDDVAGRWVNLGDFQSLSLDEAYNNFGVNPAKVKIDTFSIKLRNAIKNAINTGKIEYAEVIAIDEDLEKARVFVKTNTDEGVYIIKLDEDGNLIKMKTSFSNISV